MPPHCIGLLALDAAAAAATGILGLVLGWDSSPFLWFKRGKKYNYAEEKERHTNAERVTASYIARGLKFVRFSQAVMVCRAR